MEKGILTSWIAQLAAVFARPFRSSSLDAYVLATVKSEPLAVVLMPATGRRVVFPRPLALQLASQARLNVVVGRKPRTTPSAAAKRAKPKPVRVCASKQKRRATPRSVFLQARHRVVSLVRPVSAAIIALPVKAKSARPVVRLGSCRVTRFAA